MVEDCHTNFASPRPKQPLRLLAQRQSLSAVPKETLDIGLGLSSQSIASKYDGRRVSPATLLIAGNGDIRSVR
jgi:hypothetical protein